MKVNYDDWKVKVLVKLNDKMRRTLAVMADGVERNRVDMLRAAGVDPDPYEYGASAEYTDYHLYRKGFLTVVKIIGKQKVFKITPEGLKALSS